VSDGTEVSGAKGGKKGQEGCAGQIGPVKWCIKVWDVGQKGQVG
jgi:hypothetical protein